MSVSSSAAHPAVPALSRQARVVPALLAFMLGAFVLFGVGLAEIPALHNAAHDMRHSNAFPCH